MRLLVLCSCVLFLPLPGDGQQALKTDLMSVPHVAKGKSLVATPSTDQKIATDLMALAERTHEPSVVDVQQFARELSKGLQTAHPHEIQIDQMIAEITAVFHSAGTSTADFLDHVRRFGEVANEAAVANHSALARQLQTIGKQVRGPEDTPVRVPAQPFRQR